MDYLGDIFPPGEGFPVVVLQFIQGNEINNDLSDIWLSLQILLALSVITVSVEKSSKVQLMKVYLGFVMPQNEHGFVYSVLLYSKEPTLSSDDGKPEHSHTQ